MEFSNMMYQKNCIFNYRNRIKLTFVDIDGNKKETFGKIGDTLLNAAINGNVDIGGKLTL